MHNENADKLLKFKEFDKVWLPSDNIAWLLLYRRRKLNAMMSLVAHQYSIFYKIIKRNAVKICNVPESALSCNTKWNIFFISYTYKIFCMYNTNAVCNA